MKSSNWEMESRRPNGMWMELNAGRFRKDYMDHGERYRYSIENGVISYVDSL